MKIYFVAVRKDEDTAIYPFTSAVKQKTYFKSLPKDYDAWMYGPIDFPLGGGGIMAALEYGIKSHAITIDNCDPDDYDCGGCDE